MTCRGGNRSGEYHVAVPGIRHVVPHNSCLATQASQLEPRNSSLTPARYVVTTCSGKKYQRLKARKVTEDWADKYKPFLVPSVNFPNMMFCALTNHVIQKKHAVVEGHLKVRSGEGSEPRVPSASVPLR